MSGNILAKPNYDGFFIGGANSLVHPSALPDGQYAWGYNVMNRGGIIQTRPGFPYRGAIIGAELQGLTIFRPRNSLPTMIVAVDGYIYVARIPFRTFEKIDGVRMNVSGPIEFTPTLRSTKRNLDGTITVIEPKPLLMIMDGSSPNVAWDGLTPEILNKTESPYYQTPPATGGRWISSRFWFYRGTRFFAADLGDPTCTSENQYLAGQSGFELPGDITGMLEVPKVGTLVFTEEGTTAFQTQVRDRTKWNDIPNFQETVLPEIGCVAGRTAINHFGKAKWLSQYGHIDFDAALSAQVSSKIQVNDGPMLRSKRYFSPDVSGACAVAFENLLLLSVPSGDKYNSHTWVLDQSPVGEGAGNPCWAGVWIGPRPVAWAKTRINGRHRLYCASYDKTVKDETRIHIWEAFGEDRKDNDNNPIKCQVTFRQTFTQGMRQKFLYAEIAVAELLGKVDLQAYVSGQRGKWHLILDTVLNAQEGCIGAPGYEVITAETILKAYRPQTRMVVTKEFSPQDSGICHPESADSPGDDNGFQILLEWRGRMGVQSVTIYTNEGQRIVAKCYATEEGKVLAVAESGEVPQ